LDALQAAILNVKLKYLPKWIDQRRKNAKFYDERLPEVVKPIVEAEGAKHSYYMYVIRTPKRDKLKKFLEEKGIGCGIHYPIPLHLQPAYSHLGYKKGDFPVAEKLSKEILSIPVYPELTTEQMNYIVESIKEFFNP